MKKSALYSMFLFGCLLAGCSQIDYNHPLDNTFNYENPDFFKDDNNDSIVNLWDTSSSQYKSHLDVVPPVLKLLAQNPTMIAYEDPNQIVKYLQSDRAYEVDDNRGKENVKVEIRGTDFSVIFPNTNKVYYTARDKAGNSVTDSLTVIVLPQAFKDTIKPQISVSMTDIQMYQNEEFDPMKNVRAFDEPDGDITAKITITGSVDTKKPGVYTLTYKVKDNAGLEDTLVRKITVIENTTNNDNDMPVITLTGGDTVYIGEKAAWVEPGYKAEDKTDGDITKLVKVTGTVGNAPDWYEITYSVTDKGQNSISKTRTVRREGTIIGDDILPPVITLKNPRDTLITIMVGGVFKAPDVEIKDANDGIIPPTSMQVVGTVDVNKPGIYPVTLLVSDKAGNPGRLLIKVKVSEGDKTPPVITLKGKNPDTVTISVTTLYKDSGATATDDVDGTIPPTSISVTGKVDRTKAGTNTLTYTVSDKAGNPGTATRTVIVKESSSSNLLEKYEVPQPKALPTVSGPFTKAEVEGTDGPNLSNLTSLSFKFRNEQYSQGFDEFAITISGNYKGLMSAIKQTFASPEPGLTLTGSGITNLDGEYHVTGTSQKFIWVKKDGSFAIIWTP